MGSCMNINPIFYMEYYDLNYSPLDSTTPYYEFLSYVECCKSLNVKPSITRFVKYNQYFNTYGKN